MTIIIIQKKKFKNVSHGLSGIPSLESAQHFFSYSPTHLLNSLSYTQAEEPLHSNFTWNFYFYVFNCLLLLLICLVWFELLSNNDCHSNGKLVFNINIIIDSKNRLYHGFHQSDGERLGVHARRHIRVILREAQPKL